MRDQKKEKKSIQSRKNTPFHICKISRKINYSHFWSFFDHFGSSSVENQTSNSTGSEAKISQSKKRSRRQFFFYFSRLQPPSCHVFVLFSFFLSLVVCLCFLPFSPRQTHRLESLFVKAQCRLIFESTPRRKPTGGNSILARDRSVKTKLNSGVWLGRPMQPSRR